MCSLLFTGLLINRSKVKPWLQWLHTVSFFHAAFEALAVNELRFLQLKEDKVGSPSFPRVNRERLLTNVFSTELSSTFPRLRSFPRSASARSRSGGQTYHCLAYSLSRLLLRASPCCTSSCVRGGELVQNYRYYTWYLSHTSLLAYDT